MVSRDNESGGIAVVKFELSDGDQQGEVRADVEATFEPTILSKGIEPILDVLVTNLKSTIAKRLNVHIEQLEISQDRVHVILFFGRSSELSLDDMSRIKVNYIFYLFALIDKVATLRQAPFPDTYKYFINLPKTLAVEYGWE